MQQKNFFTADHFDKKRLAFYNNGIGNCRLTGKRDDEIGSSDR